MVSRRSAELRSAPGLGRAEIAARHAGGRFASRSRARRAPLIAVLMLTAACAAGWFARDLPERQRESGEPVAIRDVPSPEAGRAGGAPDDRRRLSAALGRLRPRGGPMEIAPAAAVLEVPAHFRFVDRDALQALYQEIGGSPDASSMGWLVHESVALGSDDAWFVAIQWLGDGYVRENGFATRTGAQLLVDAQDAAARLSERRDEGDPAFRLVRYVDVPSFDVGRDSATWVEELAYEGAEEHRLDCYALKLGRHGVLLFSILEVGVERRELCLRSVRMAAARTRFEPGQTYADHSRLFDRKASYDLAAVVSGAAALRDL